MITVRTLRIIRWTAFVLIVLIASGVAVIKFRPAGNPQLHAVAINTPVGTVTIPEGVPIGGPFNLINDKGHAVTDADYRGRWMLIFFGYSNCPDECPLTLQKMATVLAALGPLADRIVPLFITVDPAHDTPSKLTEYLGNFDTRITGLTGSSEQIAAAAAAYRIYYSPAEHELHLLDESGRQAGCTVLSGRRNRHIGHRAARTAFVVDTTAEPIAQEGHTP
jgi:cytochrome oxidase Cu insertion factor (SCO1/SenC/PrrC family)